MTPTGGTPPADRRRSELVTRTLSGLVMALIAIAATWVGGPLFGLLWLAAGITVAAEWLTITRTEPRQILIAVAAAGLVGMAVALNLGAPALVTVAVAVATASALAVLGRSGIARLWAIAGFGYAAVLVLVPAVVRADAAFGAVAIAWMFAVVWSTDVVAFFVGRGLGGPKLWPRVSPKKTWSGFAGGVAAAVLAGSLVVVLGAGMAGSGPSPGLGPVAVLSALASVASQVGDLGESALKRAFDVKDSGRIIPGHGGVMDRLDGFIAVALVVGIAFAGTRLVVR